MDTEKKHLEMGRIATALLQLHLEKPKEFDATRIVSTLFDKFEELELEQDFDEDEKSVKK